jgi:hypothetical protein
MATACPHRNSCTLLGLYEQPGAAALWTANYCEADHSRCQRIRYAQAGRKVPHNLLPNGRLMGLQIPGPLDGQRLV